MENLYVICKCGKKAFEMDYENESLSWSIYDKFGSMDDHNFFPCSCGEINPMHYTGYDCLIEDFEYSSQLTDDLRMLNSCGEWVICGGAIKESEKEKVSEQLLGFEEFHKIESYEHETFFRKGLTFKSMIYNPIHKNYMVSTYKANEKDINKLIKYFMKGGN